MHAPNRHHYDKKLLRKVLHQEVAYAAIQVEGALHILTYLINPAICLHHAIKVGFRS